MRQYIIKNQPNSPVADNTISLKVGSGDFQSMRLTPGVTMLTLPMKLQLMHPEDEKSMNFQFKLPKDLLISGIMLMGAYKDGDSVTFGLFNTAAHDLRLKEMQPVLNIEVTEKASLKSVLSFPDEVKGAAAKQKKTTQRRGHRP